MKKGTHPTITAQLQNRILNNRVVAGMVVVALAIGGVATFTDGLDRVIRFVESFFRRDRQARVQEYCQLLTPLVVQLDRTLAAFKAYTAHDFVLEETLADGNTKARELLVGHAGQIPPVLESARVSLVDHYDRWLEEYRRVRQISADSVTAFIFVGPKGHPFPQDAERAFRERRDSVARYINAGKTGCTT